MARSLLARLLLGEEPSQSAPLSDQIMNNPIGTQRLNDQSLTAQNGLFDPVVGTVDRQPWTQSQVDSMPVNPLSGKLNDDGRMIANILMGASSGLRGGLFHGSPIEGLATIKPSEYGALGPATYLTPDMNVAQKYAQQTGSAGKVYEAAAPEGLFYGMGGRYLKPDMNPYAIWREQIGKLAQAAPAELRDEIAGLAQKYGPSDGYPLFVRLAQMTKSEKAAQEIFKRAGFSGVSGMADGPEVAIFGSVPVKR